MGTIQRGYDVVMDHFDDEYLYTLLRVERRRFTFYKLDRNCRRLQELWLVGGKTPADVGIASIDGNPPACVFTSYEDLSRAFKDLLADGGLEPGMVLAQQ